MYEFNAKNGKLEKIKAKIYKDNKWVLRNIKTIIANKETFSYKTNYHYILEDNNLYINLVSEDITNIVRINDLDIFYLKDDLLYHFNPYKGEELLLRYFEWHFNSNNMVYIN